MEMTENSASCRNCGAKVKQGSAFCTRCGTPFGGLTGKGQAAKVAEGRRGGKRAAALVLTFILSLLVPAAYHWVGLPLSGYWFVAFSFLIGALGALGFSRYYGRRPRALTNSNARPRGVS
jgi:hypothetical protein